MGSQHNTCFKVELIMYKQFRTYLNKQLYFKNKSYAFELRITKTGLDSNYLQFYLIN